MQNFDATKQKLLQSDKNLLQAGGGGGLTRPSSTIGRTKTKTKKPVRSESASAVDVEDRG